MATDRMYQVIVLGGIALVGAACGSTVIDQQTAAAASGAGGFPSEGPPLMDASSDAPDGGDIDDGFPSEGPVWLDAGDDTMDAGDEGDADASFPQEAPP